MYGVRRDAPFYGSTLADSISDDEVRRAESAFNSLLKRAEKAEAELEVERQRADDAESKLRSEKLVHLVTKDAMRKAHRRVVELEGDQVPVSAEFFADGKWWPFSNAEHKANTLAAGYPVRELFTAAPKPVVLPMPFDINVAGERVDWKGGDYYDRDDVLAAIEAAGGIVKT